MEEILNGEQLEESSENVQDCNVKEEEERGTAFLEETKGSLGKFKDADSLLDAYNNLQAEFTRKCQKLSEITKQLEEEKSLKQQELKQEDIPVFKKENWKDEVSSFLTQNSEAKKYSAEIANEIFNDKTLQSSANALELAWARVMQKNYAEPEKLANDQNFINEKILSQTQVKQQVLNEYFKNLNTNSLPTVMSGRGSVGNLSSKAPTNLKEAKQILEKMLNVN